MTFKDNVIVFFIVLLGIAFMVGTFSLLMWNNENDKREAKQRCADNAKIFDIKEHYSDGYDCYVIKDGKIVEVK